MTILGMVRTSFIDRFTVLTDREALGRLLGSAGCLRLFFAIVCGELSAVDADGRVMS
jgi:hypothetical protein